LMPKGEKRSSRSRVFAWLWFHLPPFALLIHLVFIELEV
jgi:hypothetical protein